MREATNTKLLHQVLPSSLHRAYHSTVGHGGLCRWDITKLQDTGWADRKGQSPGHDSGLNTESEQFETHSLDGLVEKLKLHRACDFDEGLTQNLIFS